MNLPLSKISMGFGMSLQDFLLLGCRWRPFPAEILGQSYPSYRSHRAPRPARATEPSVAVRHKLVLLTNRNGFNGALMVASIVASVHFLQRGHHRMGHTLLCAAMAAVPYLLFFPV